MTRLRWILPEAATGSETLPQRLKRRRGLGDPATETSHDPFLLEDMDRATARIRAAISKGERILVFGDYDADGVTGTALLLLGLRALGARVGHRLPHRLHDGYGLQTVHVEDAKRAGVDLLITVDNGTSALEPLRRAAELGLDTIVVDHHVCTGDLPPVLALVNPRRPGSSYPFAPLAAVGLVYKLLQALGWKKVDEGLDLVALGTVADMASLTGENRWMVQRGLERMNGRARPGMEALKRLKGVLRGPVDARCLGWQLGPRINCAGRLGEADWALELLLADHPERAWQQAVKLDQLNGHRRKVQQDAVDDAEKALKGAGAMPPLVLVTGGDWHLGVVGLIAGKLCNDLDRPVVALTRSLGGGVLKGSARSIPGYHITEAFARHAEHLVEFGGHAEAAGLTLREERLRGFSEALLADAAAALPEEREADLRLDEIAVLGELDLSLVDGLAGLEPFGVDNPLPLLGLLDVPVQRIFELSGGKHLKLWLGEGGRRGEAVWWNCGPPPDWLRYGQRVDLAFEPERNLWNGSASLQLNLRALRPAGGFR